MLLSLYCRSSLIIIIKVAKFDLGKLGTGKMAQQCAYGRSVPLWQHEHTLASAPFDLLELDFGGLCLLAT